MRDPSPQAGQQSNRVHVRKFTLNSEELVGNSWRRGGELGHIPSFGSVRVPVNTRAHLAGGIVSLFPAPSCTMRVGPGLWPQACPVTCTSLSGSFKPHSMGLSSPRLGLVLST